MNLTSTSPASHIRITQALLLALLEAIAGEAVALVPSWAPEKATIIQAGTFAIAIGFLIANAIHAHAAGPATVLPATYDTHGNFVIPGEPTAGTGGFTAHLGETLAVPAATAPLGAQVNINVHQPPAQVHPNPPAATVQVLHPEPPAPTPPVAAVSPNTTYPPVVST